MRCDDPRIWWWARVPDDSHLELCVEPAEGHTTSCFSARAVFDVDEGTDKVLDHATLVSCSHEERLSTPRRYVVNFIVTFTAQEECTVRVRARVRRPDGATHAGPYCREVSGRRDEIERCHLLVSTLRSGA